MHNQFAEEPQYLNADWQFGILKEAKTIDRDTDNIPPGQPPFCSSCLPNPEDVINIFLVRIQSVSVFLSAFISVHYLPNQLIEFDQTCMDTLLREGEELNRFW